MDIKMRLKEPYFMDSFWKFLTLITLLTRKEASANTLCVTGSVQVTNCVRKVCDHGALREQPCAPGLLPSNTESTGCTRPELSECSNALVQQKLSDPCADKPCINGSCIASNDKTAFVCVCHIGYRGRFCHIDIDDCIDRPCQNGGTCVDHVNAFSCQCPSNFTGKICESEAKGAVENACSSNPCKNGGFCADAGQGKFYCVCRPELNFTGPTCEDVRGAGDPCISQPCQNKGLCYKNGTSFVCFCTPGFTGATCQLKQDPCARNLCQNGAKCVSLNNMQEYSCQCKPGFQGTLCDQVSRDPCSVTPCKNGGFCIPSAGKSSFTCQCINGYTGQFCDLKMENIMNDKCSQGEQLLPHSEYCQLYYNCSNKVSQIPGRPWEMYLDECPYPQLFDNVTKRCQAFTQVKCGTRKEVVDYCKYLKQTCLTMCSPCEIQTPSCIGLSDGMHANPYKANTPYFITCFRNRTTLTSMCGKDGFGRRKLFKSDQFGSGSCKSIYEIPQENGGKQPKCSSNAFTLHSDPSGHCSMYYFCLGGKATVLECAKGKVFKNTLTEPVCQDPSTVCPPCGTKTENCS